MEARAADALLLDHRDVHAGRRAVERRRVAARPATEHDKVEIVRHRRTINGRP